MGGGVIAWAIRRPVTVTVGVILVVMFGVLSIQGIPIQLTPDVTVPTISVTTVWPGATPTEVEAEILEEQEEALFQADGKLWAATEDEKSVKQAYNWERFLFEEGHSDKETLDGIAKELSDLTSIRAAETDRRRRRKIEQVVARGPLPGQSGLAVMHGSKLVSVEVFATATPLADHWEEITRSIFDEDDPVPTGRASADRVLRELRRVASMDWATETAPGNGRTAVAHDDRYTARVLEDGGALIHAAMFALAA